MRSKNSDSLTTTVNGNVVPIPSGEATLLDFLREDIDLTGAKKACDNGECGSCIVVMSGKPTKSCLLPAARAAKKEILTIEGLTPHATDFEADADISFLHPIQQAFLEKGATQCGFCIPGMIMKAYSLLKIKPNPDREDIVKGLSKNLCRCTGYTKIIEAVAYAAELIDRRTLRGGRRKAERRRCRRQRVAPRQPCDGYRRGQVCGRLESARHVVRQAAACRASSRSHSSSTGRWMRR